VGLPKELARRYPHQLSGGQQQRVGVARALAADPPVLLMDEPFSAVDPIVRKGLQEEFLRIQAAVAKTILFVTHDIDEAVKLGDKIAVLRQGGILAQFDTPDRLLAEPADEFVEQFLGTDRGIKRLTFYTADGLNLLGGPVVAADTGTAAAREAAAAGDFPWLLVVDERRRPLGWTNPETLSGSQPVGKTRLVSYGHAFRADTDSLRAALDSAVLSPTGWAVGVDAEGAVVGVASQETIADAIRTAHATRAHPDVTPGRASGDAAGDDTADDDTADDDTADDDTPAEPAEDAGPEDRPLEQAR